MGRKPRYSDEKFIETIKQSTSWRQTIHTLGLKYTGGNVQNLKSKADRLGADTSHFKGQGWNKGDILNKEEEIFCKNSKFDTDYVKKCVIVLNRMEYKCSRCGIDKWNDDHIALELHHKNGDTRDHRLSNICFVCPNCHSQTPYFRGRNAWHGLEKVSDEDLIEAIKNNRNIRTALLYVGLRGKGANYTRVKELILKHDLDFKEVVKPEKKPKETQFCGECNREITRKSKTGFCVTCSQKNQRKVKDRPSRDTLLKLVKKDGYCATARKYNVSDNTIRKWLKK